MAGWCQQFAGPQQRILHSVRVFSRKPVQKPQPRRLGGLVFVRVAPSSQSKTAVLGLGCAEGQREWLPRKVLPGGTAAIRRGRCDSCRQKRGGLPPWHDGNWPRKRIPLTTTAASASDQKELMSENGPLRLTAGVEEGQGVAAVPEVEALGVCPPPAEQTRQALLQTAFWVSAAATFGTAVGFTMGSEKASEFFAGYLLEESLSVDNLFVFILIFDYFQVPQRHQNRVLSFGIFGAVVFRAAMILLGVATLKQFEVINLLFAGILLFSSYKLLQEGDEEDEDLSQNFIVRFCQRYIPVTASYSDDRFFVQADGIVKATPLLLTLAVVELSDIAFAVDSIPAVFGVTRDPFIVYTSNIFAILGLRSLYTLISGFMANLRYLQPSIAIVLGFIGVKMIFEYFGGDLDTGLSLAVVATLLGGGVLLSLREGVTDPSHTLDQAADHTADHTVDHAAVPTTSKDEEQ